MAKARSWIKRIFLLVIVAIAAWIGYNLAHDRVVGPPVQAANLSDMRSLNTALKTYHSLYGHYPQSLGELGVPEHGPSSEHGAGLLGSKLATGHSHGYQYTYAATTGGYEIHGDPEKADNNVHLYSDQTAEIRAQRNKPAEKSSDIQQ